MKMISRLFVLLFLFAIHHSLFTAASAQELKCSVKINTPKLQSTDPKIFQTLQKAMFDFMNNRKWTEDVFEVAEKIECNIVINVTDELGSDKYRLQMNIQSSRQIYNSSYNSTILNWSDKDFVIQYVEYQPLDYADDRYASNLTSVLAFYAYTMIGLDYDTYSPKGGTPYFDKAKSIVTIMQNYDEEGWKPFEKNLKNRYWISDNLSNSKSDVYRSVLYNYHRNGLDVMYQSAENGRAAIVSSLKQIEKMYEDNPNGVLLTQFFAAKSDELANIFMDGTPQEKQQMSALLNRIDPANSKKYTKILGK